MNKKTFCVIQHYRVEVEVEGENADEAKAMLYDEPNLYKVTATDTNPNSEILSIGVYACESRDDEVYESMPTDETRAYGPQGDHHAQCILKPRSILKGLENELF